MSQVNLDLFLYLVDEDVKENMKIVYQDEEFSVNEIENSFREFLSLKIKDVKKGNPMIVILDAYTKDDHDL